MNVDKETQPRWINIVLDSNPSYFNELKRQADEDGQNENDEGKERIAITMDKHSFKTDEYYFDEEKNELVMSGTLKSENGETYLAISMPLSDAVLIDILHHSIKKLNKLKTALEAIK